MIVLVCGGRNYGDIPRGIARNKGTADMVRKAKAAGVKVVEVAPCKERDGV